MSLSHKPIQNLAEPDLQKLIGDKEAESKTIDYKTALPGKEDAAKKEFLYDVSSFANTAGGYLVFGMKERNGEPTELVGISGINPEQEVQRIDEMMRDGIHPPIVGIHTVSIRLPNSNFAFVIRIPQSWNPPHQVTYQKAFRIYARGSNGKYQMEVDELRSVFTLSATVGERIQRFRMERLGKIQSGDVPPMTAKGAFMITHFLPLSAFNKPVAVNLEPLLRNVDPFMQIIGGLEHSRFNADGFIAWARSSYVQMFRSGGVEVVQVLSGASQDGSPGLVASMNFDMTVQRHMRACKQYLKSFGIEPPIVVLMALTGLKGWRMAVSPEYSISALDVFDRDLILIPEILLETLDNDHMAEARLLIDAAWNSAGWPRSPYYTEDGKWTDRRY